MDHPNQTTGLITEPPKAAGPRPRLLIDARPISLQMIEGKEGSKKIVVRGEFARCNLATENNRVYPAKLWERELSRLGKAMHERQVFGELDHPSDGRTSLARVSHIVTNLSVEDGIVIGEAEILDTQRGKDLQALLSSGCKVGVSSRGYGSVKSNEKGEDIVQEDYRLVTFDFVAEPADSNAYPDVFFEGKEKKMGAEENISEEVLATKIEEARRDEREKLRSEFEHELLKVVSEQKAEIRKALEAEILADPALAGARSVVSELVRTLRSYGLDTAAQSVVSELSEEVSKLKAEISERDLKIKSLQEDLEKISTVAREAGLRFYVERRLSGNPDAETIRKSLGNVSEFKELGDLKSKLESVIADLAQKRQEQLEAEKRKDAEKKAFEQKLSAVKSTYDSKMEELTKALKKTQQENKNLNLKLHAERRLAGNPKSENLRSVLESVKVESKEDVDNVLRRLDNPVRNSEELESVRSRVRRATRGGLSTTPADEEAPIVESRDFNGLGLPIDTLKKLSGLK